MLRRGVVSAWVSKETDRKEGTRKEKVLRLKYITEGKGQGEGPRVSLLSKDQEGGGWGRSVEEGAGLLGDSGRDKGQKPDKRAGG